MNDELNMVFLRALKAYKRELRTLKGSFSLSLWRKLYQDFAEDFGKTEKRLSELKANGINTDTLETCLGAIKREWERR